MLLIRPSRPEDVGALVSLAGKAGFGMTNLPPDEGKLSARIDHSMQSFADDANHEPDDPATYFMVLEDTENRRIVGTSGIYARIGVKQPFFTYKLITLVQSSRLLNKSVSSQILQLSNNHMGNTEIGMLFLDPDYRGAGAGRLLGACRYLLMAQFPDIFADTVIAEMRGWHDEGGISPFWNAIGAHFFEMSFAEADNLSALRSNQFISDLMPKHPIYVDLLPGDAQAVIGKPHDETRPALRLLENEGFRYHGVIDIFDGGPMVEVPRQAIRSIRNSRHATVAAIAPEASLKEKGAKQAIVANTTLAGFRCCAGPLLIDDDGVTISADCAAALAVGKGDGLRLLPYGKKRKKA